MDELIIKTLAGTATPAQEEQVARWREEAAEHDAQFLAIAAIWESTAPLPQPDVPPVPDAATLRAMAEEADGMTDRPVPIHGSRGRLPWSRRLGWGVALAAAAAAVVALGPWGWPDAASSPGPVATFVADAATSRTVTLADGSVVKLAPGSRLEEWGSEESRTVALSGRAFFAVVHDPARPFLVRVADAETRVMGTRFEVWEEEPGDVRVVVVEGRVAVSNPGGRLEVPAGSVARARSREAPSAQVSDDVFALLDWPEGVLVFQETPLGQVAEEVGRYFDRSVVVEGDSLRGLRITALFEGQLFEDVVAALCDVTGVDCRLTEDGATIGAAG